MRIRLSQKTGIWLLGIWLILTGLLSLGVSFPFAGLILGILALAAGIMIVIDS